VARAIGNAVACCGPSKFGSVSAVRNGIVLGVEMTRDPADLAADEAAGTAARTQSAATAQLGSAMRTHRWRDVVCQRETRVRTAAIVARLSATRGSLYGRLTRETPRAEWRRAGTLSWRSVIDQVALGMAKKRAIRWQRRTR
jgi:hypothetical protein